MHVHGTTLPETLGVGLQEKPPLDWSVSPKSYVSLGLGLYSLLGREEASLILEGGEEMWINQSENEHDVPGSSCWVRHPPPAPRSPRDEPRLPPVCTLRYVPQGLQAGNRATWLCRGAGSFVDKNLCNPLCWRLLEQDLAQDLGLCPSRGPQGLAAEASQAPAACRPAEDTRAAVCRLLPALLSSTQTQPPFSSFPF